MADHEIKTIRLGNVGTLRPEDLDKYRVQMSLFRQLETKHGYNGTLQHIDSIQARALMEAAILERAVEKQTTVKDLLWQTLRFRTQLPDLETVAEKTFWHKD